MCSFSNEVLYIYMHIQQVSLIRHFPLLLMKQCTLSIINDIPMFNDYVN